MEAKGSGQPIALVWGYQAKETRIVHEGYAGFIIKRFIS